MATWNEMAISWNSLEDGISWDDNIYSHSVSTPLALSFSMAPQIILKESVVSSLRINSLVTKLRGDYAPQVSFLSIMGVNSEGTFDLNSFATDSLHMQESVKEVLSFNKAVLFGMKAATKQDNSTVNNFRVKFSNSMQMFTSLGALYRHDTSFNLVSKFSEINQGFYDTPVYESMLVNKTVGNVLSFEQSIIEPLVITFTIHDSGWSREVPLKGAWEKEKVLMSSWVKDTPTSGDWVQGE